MRVPTTLAPQAFSLVTAMQGTGFATQAEEAISVPEKEVAWGGGGGQASWVPYGGIFGLGLEGGDNRAEPVPAFKGCLAKRPPWASPLGVGPPRDLLCPPHPQAIVSDWRVPGSAAAPPGLLTTAQPC